MLARRAMSVAEYLSSLSADRRRAIETVRRVILANLPRGYEEGIQYGMIGYYIPLSRYPTTYNGQPLTIASLGAQKNHMALYLMGVYGHEPTRAWFEKAYRESGKTLDMGKSCVRFAAVDDLPLEVIGQVIARIPVETYIDVYEASRAGKTSAKRKPAAKTKRTVRAAARRR